MLPVWQLYSDPRILNVKGIDGFACLGLHSPGGTFFTASLNLILGHLQSVVFNMARRQTSTLPECGNRAQKFFWPYLSVAYLVIIRSDLNIGKGLELDKLK